MNVNVSINLGNQMKEPVSENLAARSVASDEQGSLADDLLWAVKAISEEINRSERQTSICLRTASCRPRKKGAGGAPRAPGCGVISPTSCGGR
jgi:hypothetical protein